jgi:hypothetical protein
MSHRSTCFFHSERAGRVVGPQAGSVAGQAEGPWRDGRHCFTLAIFQTQKDHAEKDGERRRTYMNALSEA